MRKFTWAALAAIFICGSAAAQGNLYQDSVLRPTAVIAGASVRVCTKAATGTPCSPPASIYSDEALTMLDADSIVAADSRGHFKFYSAESCVQLQISAAGFSTLTIPACSPSTSTLAATQVVTFSATPTFDTSASRYFRMTLTGNVTSSTLGGAVTGRIAYFNLCQDATGGRTFAWPAAVLNAPTIGTAANSCTSVSLIYDGTNWRELAPTSRGSAVFDTVTVGKQNNILSVNETLSRGGVDIGDEINRAYATLPFVSTGTGKIVVGAPSTNTCYNFSTPIAITTANKPADIDFQGTCLNWTPSSGTALTMDTGQQNTAHRGGFNNLHLTTGAAGSTATGVRFGNTNGSQQSRSYNLQVNGFKTLVDTGGLNVHLFAPTLGPCSSDATSVGLLVNSGSDDLRVFGGSIFECNKLVSHDTAGAGPFFLFGTSLLEAKGGVSPVYISHTVNERSFVIGSHFAALTATGSDHIFLNQTTGRVIMTSPVFEDDRTSGSQTSYMTVSGGSLHINHADISSAGHSVTQFVTFSGSAAGHLSGMNNSFSFSLIPLIWNTAYAGGPVTEEGTLGDPNGTTTGIIDRHTYRKIKPLALEFAGNFANPATNTATIYDQAGVGLTVNGAAFSVRTGTTPAQRMKVTDTEAQVHRVKASLGTALVAGDFALSAGWGTTASVGSIIGTDQGSQFVVTSAGTGQGANPTITVTDKDGTWTNSPIVIVQRSAGSQLTVVDTWTVTATALTITFNGTPVAAETFTYNVIKMGR